MEEKMAIEKIRNAVEIATKKIILMNDKDKTEQNKENDNFVYYQHENFLNAMIYHELVSDSYFPFDDVYMEALYPQEASSGKNQASADMAIFGVFNDNNVEDLFCEVKSITYNYKKEGNVIPTDKLYFSKDIKKLQKLMDYNNPVPVKGIIIIVNMTRYPGTYYKYNPMSIILNTLKTILSEGKYSDDMVFILSDNARAIAITAGEINGHKA
jgi:hypothetical protein